MVLDFSLLYLCLCTESLKDLVAMEVDVKAELPTPPASDAGSPEPSGSFSHCSSDSEPDSPMGEDSKVVCLSF